MSEFSGLGPTLLQPRSRRSSAAAVLEPHLEQTRRLSVPRVPKPLAWHSGTTDNDEQDRQEGSGGVAAKADVPVWWLFVISSYCVPLGLTNTLIGNILLPPLIQRAVGDESKEAALGLASSVCNAIHTIEPFLGVISDRCVWRYRRRTFVIVGQCLIVIGILGFWSADISRSYWQLMLAYQFQFRDEYFLFHVGCMVGWVPYVAIIPELPPHQRALGASVIAFTCGMCEGVGSLLGIAIGRHWLSNDFAWVLMVVLNVINIVLGCLSMGDTPGWFTAERPAPPLLPADEGKSCLSVVRSRLCSPGRLKTMCQDFLSAFRTSPAFARMFLINFIGSLNPLGTFHFYWYQDVFAPNFDVFGHSIIGCAKYGDVGNPPGCKKWLGHDKKWILAHQTQTAIATMSIISQVMRTLTALPGGSLDKRFFGSFRRRKAVLLALRLFGLPLGAVYLWHIPFTVVFCLSAYDWLVGGLTNPINSAFAADCLPVDDDGRPRDPTRDTLIGGWAGIIPGLVMPIIGGQLFSVFKDHFATYHFLFAWQLVLGVVCSLLFATMPAPLPPGQQLTPGDSKKNYYRAPLGARLCDLLCFGHSIRDAERA